MADRTKVLTGLVVAFAIVCVVLAGVLVWREHSRPKTSDTSFTSTVVHKSYPGLFRTPVEQLDYEAKYLNSFYKDRKVVNVTVPSRDNTTCRYSCSIYAQNIKKRALQQYIYHGCCASSVSFIMPPQLTNTRGQLRTLVQLPSYRQYFAIHSCRRVTECDGCTCSQESNVYTAVVVKFGVTNPSSIADTEMDFFFLDGCCKCVNN